jgi:hypothetical protein
VRLKACVFIGLAVHALIYILLIFKFDLYRGACGGGRAKGIAKLITMHVFDWYKINMKKFTPLSQQRMNMKVE